MKKVLFIDNEINGNKELFNFLVNEGFYCIETDSGDKALYLLRKRSSFDVVILNVMMPKYNGWAVCREIRKISSVPLVILTSTAREFDELFGFELGVDEYMKKPFNPQILLARIKALLRRKDFRKDKVNSFNGLEINQLEHSVSLKGMPLKLQPKEYDLLLYLSENQGIALSREQILQSVWNYRYMGYERTVDTHIKKLRKKLGEKRTYIQTVRNVGYRFSAKL